MAGGGGGVAAVSLSAGVGVTGGRGSWIGGVRVVLTGLCSTGRRYQEKQTETVWLPFVHLNMTSQDIKAIGLPKVKNQEV